MPYKECSLPYLLVASNLDYWPTCENIIPVGGIMAAKFPLTVLVSSCLHCALGYNLIVLTDAPQETVRSSNFHA